MADDDVRAAAADSVGERPGIGQLADELEVRLSGDQRSHDLSQHLGHVDKDDSAALQPGAILRGISTRGNGSRGPNPAKAMVRTTVTGAPCD